MWPRLAAAVKLATHNKWVIGRRLVVGEWKRAFRVALFSDIPNRLQLRLNWSLLDTGQSPFPKDQ
jgi:hypothetical protein